MGGLRVSGGRLINDNPDCVAGITEAAIARKAMKEAKKMQMMSNAYAMGEMKAEMFEKPEPIIIKRG